MGNYETRDQSDVIKKMMNVIKPQVPSLGGEGERERRMTRGE
jgi:hypothetical protein